MTSTPTPFVVRPVAPSSVVDDGAAVRARAVVILEGERNPEHASIRAERDNPDARFYTGLYTLLADNIRQTIDLEMLHRDAARAERRRR